MSLMKTYALSVCLIQTLDQKCNQFYSLFFCQGVYYQFFVSANGEKGEGNTSTIVGHRIPTFANSHHQTENGELIISVAGNYFRPRATLSSKLCFVGQIQVKYICQFIANKWADAGGFLFSFFVTCLV